MTVVRTILQLSALWLVAYAANTANNANSVNDAKYPRAKRISAVPSTTNIDAKQQACSASNAAWAVHGFRLGADADDVSIWKVVVLVNVTTGCGPPRFQCGTLDGDDVSIWKLLGSHGSGLNLSRAHHFSSTSRSIK